jgi:hypothetical protein
MDIKEILGNTNSIDQKINALKKRTICVPLWSVLLKTYETSNHEVLTDTISLKDKENGEKSSRIAIGLDKLLASRFNQFTFAIPVKREYNKPSNDTQTAIIGAIEKIYENAHIDTMNFKRGIAYYAACEMFTIWYTVKRENTIYGFPCRYKLKCKTFSPMDRVCLYPIIDELDDMIAMSFEYDKKVSDTKTITIFETYTEDRHFVWEKDNQGNSWEEKTAQIKEDGTVESGEQIIINKIPGVYLWRPFPVYDGLGGIRHELEYSLSRNGNVISYNSAPIVKVKGGIIGKEKKGESSRIWRVESDGDISYVSWNQSQDAVINQTNTLLKLYWMLSQMPDISFDNMKGLGNIGYDARQTLFTEARLKIIEESGAWKECFEREFNVIKAFLKQMNQSWANEIDNITCKHIITPYVPEDENNSINVRMKANGGLPVESQLESIIKIGQSKDPISTLKEIRKDQAASAFAQQVAFNIGEQTM